MKATEFLQQVKMLDKMIENKLAEIQRWREIATNATSNLTGEKVESSHNPHKTMDAICTYMDLENEYGPQIDALKKRKMDVIHVIEQLPPTEYDILHKLYVQDYELQDIASLYQRSYGWATTAHSRAKQLVQKILDKREKNKNEQRKAD